MTSLWGQLLQKMATLLEAVLSEKVKPGGPGGGGGGNKKAEIGRLEFTWCRDTEDIDHHRCSRLVAQHIEASRAITAHHNVVHYSGDKGTAGGIHFVRTFFLWFCCC